MSLICGRFETARLDRLVVWAIGENVLADDEQLVLHRHPHVKRLIGAVLMLLLATAVAAFVAGFVNPRQWDPAAKNVIFAVTWAIWLIVVGWLTLWPFLTWLTTHFVITDRRVMFRSGLLARSGVDIPLARICHVEFTRGVVERMLRTGTLVIESAAQQDPWEFYDVPRVAQVHALLHHEVFHTLESEESSN
jgi:uncharacterized membrane protein YdbT with pleckstrin-like domain